LLIILFKNEIKGDFTMKILGFMVLGLIVAGFVELFNLPDLYEKRNETLRIKRMSKK
jgi:hypothetical protein